jgi:hypothetical protein
MCFWKQVKHLLAKNQEREMNSMYKIIGAVALMAALAGPALSATLISKPSNSEGSMVGQLSSMYTGNGANIGGGTKDTGQTSQSGERSDNIQSYLGHPGH